MPTSEHESGLVLELAEEFLARYRNGERPPISEYVATREQVAELRGHTDYVHAVAWSPDGTRLW